MGEIQFILPVLHLVLEVPLPLELSYCPYPPDILKSKDNINIYNNNIPSNFNAYNYVIVNNVCDIYIDLCIVM